MAEMQTWLDYFVGVYAERGRSQLDLEKVLSGAGLASGFNRVFGVGPEKASDLQLAQFHATRIVAGEDRLDQDRFNPETERGSAQSFNRAVLPFLAEGGMVGSVPVPSLPETACVKPTADLIEALSRTAAPQGQRETVLAELSGPSWYFDIPDRSLMIGDACVRAIITMPPTEGEGSVQVWVVLCHPGRNTWEHRMTWMFGETLYEIGGNHRGHVDSDLLQDQVEAMLSMLVLYRKYSGKAQRLPVPRKTPADMAGRKAAQNRKKFTMFRVEGLEPPPDRFGRVRKREEAGGWKLGWRSEVSGHFRLTPCGPKGADRRFVYIEAYERGPVNAPRKRRIKRLDVNVGNDT
jgi:hypothetical protein